MTVFLLRLVTLITVSALTFQTRAAADEKELIAGCKGRNKQLNENDCRNWLGRRDQALKANCPDAEAAVACKSFQELIAADDVALMNDFAQKDHVITCFRKNEDVYFNLWFTEPAPRTWQREDPRALRFTNFGSAAFDFYRDGIWDFDMSAGGSGRWEYFASRVACDETCLKEATSQTSAYKFDFKPGEHEANKPQGSIRIDKERAVLSESSEDKAGSQTMHEIVVQLSTGRFVERYESTALRGRPNSTESTGRCLILKSISQP
jgi:hypothetical protein